MNNDRLKEIKNLNDLYLKNESTISVLYGNAGVKTESVWKEFVKNKKFIFLDGYEASERQLCCYLRAQLLSLGINISDYPTFSEIISALNDVSTDKKIVIVINRIHEWSKCSDSVFDELFALVRQSKTDNKFFVLLVTDKVSFVENSLIEKLGKNAFMLSGIFKVCQLEFIDMVCSYDNDYTQSVINAYSIIGGMDNYWKYYDIDKSVKENIINLFVKEDAYFYNYGIDAILSELREPSVYATILGTICEGKNKLNEIHHHTDFTRAKISVYLKNLMELELVEKVFSFEMGMSDNTKKGVYRLSNPLAEFWFTFIYPNEYKRVLLSEEEFYEECIAPYIEAYVYRSYYKVCTEFMRLLNERNALPIHFEKSGEWVGKAGTIHLIGCDDMRNYITGYVYSDNNVMKLKDYEWYEFCLKEARVNPQYQYIFAIDGFEDEIRDIVKDRKDITLVEMKDL